VANRIYSTVCDAFTRVVSRRAAENLLSDALRTIGSTPDTVTVGEMETLLKGVVFRRLQTIIPVVRARGEIRQILDQFSEEAGSRERAPAPRPDRQTPSPRPASMPSRQSEPPAAKRPFSAPVDDRTVIMDSPLLTPELSPQILRSREELQQEFSPYSRFSSPQITKFKALLSEVGSEGTDPAQVLDALWELLMRIQDHHQRWERQAEKLGQYGGEIVALQRARHPVESDLETLLGILRRRHQNYEVIGPEIGTVEDYLERARGAAGAAPAGPVEPPPAPPPARVPPPPEAPPARPVAAPLAPPAIKIDPQAGERWHPILAGLVAEDEIEAAVVAGDGGELVAALAESLDVDELSSVASGAVRLLSRGERPRLLHVTLADGYVFVIPEAIGPAFGHLVVVAGESANIGRVLSELERIGSQERA
jgi:hypothetical protein